MPRFDKPTAGQPDDPNAYYYGGIARIVASREDWVEGTIFGISDLDLIELDKRECVDLGEYERVKLSDIILQSWRLQIEDADLSADDVFIHMAAPQEGYPFSAMFEYVSKIYLGALEQEPSEGYINKYILPLIRETLLYEHRKAMFSKEKPAGLRIESTIDQMMGLRELLEQNGIGLRPD